MADFVKPVVRLFFPCDEAILDLADQKWTLKNPWHTVGMPPGITKNFCQEEVWLYAQFTGGVGTFQMTPQIPQQEGRALKKSQVRSAVEIDCSSWENDAAVVSWTTGRFLKPSLVRAAVDVDCSGWPEGPAVSLELTVHPTPAIDSVQLALGMFAVLNAVNSLDRAWGGTGFGKVVGQQCNGAVTIILGPERHAGAAERIGRICDHVNRVSATTALPLPASVKTVQARVV